MGLNCRIKLLTVILSVLILFDEKAFILLLFIISNPCWASMEGD